MRKVHLLTVSLSALAALSVHGVALAWPAPAPVPAPVLPPNSATRSDVPVTPVPAGFGHYCSLRYQGGGWAFLTTGAGTDPCRDALTSTPGGTIERAGLWSLSGKNNVLVRCGGDLRIYSGAGSAPTGQAYTEAQGKVGCVFVVSPAKLPVFSRPYGKSVVFQPNADVDVSHSNGFDYAQFGRKLDATMFGQTGTSWSIIDRFGKGHSSGADGHDGHDWVMPRGKPILAVADGLVLAARKRDVTAFNCGATDNEKFQAEIYVLHTVGTGTYQERFVSYYAHMSAMKVATGDRVTRGQQLGSAGDTGCSSTDHLHMGVSRLTNLTGSRYHNFRPLDVAHGDTGFGSRIDPYGWQAPKHVDPWAWMYLGDITDPWATYHDPGAFSLDLWRSGQAPPAANW